LIPLLICFPYVRFIRPYSAIFWPCILTLAIGIRLCFVVNYSAINILISNLAPPNRIGATNGLSATFASGSRTLAPIFAGSIFAATANFDHFPLDASFMFVGCAIICSCLLVGGCMLPNSVNKRRLESME
jgi:hypothetical protein